MVNPSPVRRVARTAGLALALVGSLVVAPVVGAVPAGADPTDVGIAGVDLAAFADPSIDFRPGVRWWWPGNAASKEDLLDQVDYLHDNGFGAVEIVAFSKGFLTSASATSQPRYSGYVYDAREGYDREQIEGYESPEYFDKLDAVVERANELGITVDLNIGSGYLASDDSIDIADSQNNLALGRATVRRDGSGDVTVESGDITVSTSPGGVEVGIPDAEASPFYGSEKFGFDFGVWSPDDVRLTAVTLAPVSDVGAPLTQNNQTLRSDFGAVKTYPNQTVIDAKSAQVFYPSAGDDTFTVDAADLPEGEYEVIALYSAPTGAFGFNSFIENTTTGKRNYVVDHLDPDAVTNLVDGWLGEPALADIVDERDIRAAFNDSYEFYTDTHYNDIVQASARSEEILGYDITRFLPAFYSFYDESFLIDGPPTVKSEIAQLGLQDPTFTRFGGSGQRLLGSTATEDESARIEYDYGRLLDSAFQGGMEAFSRSLGDYDIQYRQQAYNPPVDTLRSAEFVDIPETEGLDEYSLKRVSSGAHLYGKNLVTSEVFTLGSTPFRITSQSMKQGYDLMATSGVNNFFYHGLNAPYSGNEDPAFTSDDDLFAEEGWRAWPTIGVEMAGTAGIADYYQTMNQYAARANYAMQQGDANADVAVYMPLFGSLSSESGPLQTITALQTNGLTWDAINDDTVQNALEWDGEQLIAHDGNADFDALVVESASVPLETIQALEELKAEGAPIYFLGSAPTRQPGYADGNYAALDAEVASRAAALGGVVDAATLPGELADHSRAPISYAPNTAVRFDRRTLDGGAELAYVRNTSATQSTPVELRVSEELPTCLWLDQSTGKAYPAQVDDGKVSATLDADGAVILACGQPAASAPGTVEAAGMPQAIDDTDRPHSRMLEDFTLEVTSDNIGSNVPGQSQTFAASEGALGDWSTPDVHGGALANVSDAGTYRTTLTVPDSDALAAGGALLDLGSVFDAATVRVNGETVAQLFAAPYTVDIAPALVTGANSIEIVVQPVQSNRREGLKQAYLADPVQNARYQVYPSAHGGTGLVPAGLVGPVAVRTAVDLAAAPTLTADPSSVAQGAQTTIAGSSFFAGAELTLAIGSGATVPVNVGADGTFSVVWHVPADFPTGAVEVQARTSTGEALASTALTVTVAAPGGTTPGEPDGGGDEPGRAASGSPGDLAVTGATWTAAGVIVGALLVATGTAVVLIRRRRAEAPQE